MSFYLKETTTNSYIQFVGNQYSYISNPDKKHLFKDADKAANIVLNHSIVDKFLSKRVFSIYHAETNSLVYDKLVSDIANKGLIHLNISKAVLNIQESLSEAPVTTGNPIEMKFKDSVLPVVSHSNCAKIMIDGDDLPIKDSTKRYQASEYSRNKILPPLEVMSKTFESITSAINSLPSNEDLATQLGDYNAQVVDILHYIEFHKFSAAEGYKLCKKLQEICDRRREAKNKIQIINTIKTQSCASILSGNATKRIEKIIPDKKYTPRVFDELFKKNQSRIRKEKSVKIKI